MDGTGSVCCMCVRKCHTWWRGGDFYACVHAECSDALLAACPTLTGRAAVAAEAPRRRGGYGRHRGAVAVTPLFVPSRFPAVHDAWVALVETNVGQVSVPCGGNVGHGVAVLRRWRLLTEQRRPVLDGGIVAVGAALFTPERHAAASWGYEPVWSVSAWESLARVTEWRLCSACGAYLWPGRWVTLTGGRCVLCAHDDDRLWPPEPDFPGEEWVPVHLREDAGQRPRKRTPRAVKYADDHA